MLLFLHLAGVGRSEGVDHSVGMGHFAGIGPGADMGCRTLISNRALGNI